MLQKDHFQPFWVEVKTRIFANFAMESYMDQPAEGNLNVHL